jgi:superfamily II DNA or RNA helicase
VKPATSLPKEDFSLSSTGSLRSCLIFNAGDIPRLACVAQLSEGISIPNLRVGTIWHAFGNERKAAQRIGRLLRLNPDQTATVHLLAY